MNYEYLPGAVFCLGYVLYVYELLQKGDVGPAPPVLAFAIWMLVDLLQAVSAYEIGVSAVIPSVAVGGCGALLAVALWRGRYTLSTDCWSLWSIGIALAVVIIWGVAILVYSSDSKLLASVALVCSLVAGLLPVVPLWQALLRHPGAQGTLPWFPWLLGTLLEVWVLQYKLHATPQDYLLPWTYFLMTFFSVLLRFIPVGWRIGIKKPV